MVTLYGDPRSGNCYKVALTLSLLGTPFHFEHMDLVNGASRTPAFLSKNPNGKVPVLELEDGACLFESDAILYYLGLGTELFPSERLAQTRVLQWMFFEQYSHEPYIAVARTIQIYFGCPPDMRARYDATIKPGYKALDVMEQHLAQTPFFVDGRFSIADIALYAYTHVAEEGGFSLADYPAIQAWLDRVTQQPGFRAMASFTTP